MKRSSIIYWTATGIVSLMMIYSAIGGLTDPWFAENYRHLGFPDYFRIELAIAKLFGVFVLLMPNIAVRVKEWAYAGFGITFISASIAHGFSGDPALAVVMGLLFFILLAVSNIYFHRLRPLEVSR